MFLTVFFTIDSIKAYTPAVAIYQKLLAELKDDVVRDKELYQRVLANLVLASARASQDELQKFALGLPVPVVRCI